MNAPLSSTTPMSVPIAKLTRDPDLTCRARGVNKRTVAEYAAAMREGTVFPPITVFQDPKGACWLSDGFHRCEAAELIGREDVLADVREGTRRDALLYAAGANSAHGLRRTNADKRRAVSLLLAAWPKWSDRRIGEVCAVDNKTVAAARKVMFPSEEIPQGGQDEVRHDKDKLVAHLSKKLDRIVHDWPAERRGELAERLRQLTL